MTTPTEEARARNQQEAERFVKEHAHVPVRAEVTALARLLDARDATHAKEMEGLERERGAAIRERDEARAEVKKLEGAIAARSMPPVYCKHCPFSQHVHYEVDGKLVTPGCPGFEPDMPDQGEGH